MATTSPARRSSCRPISISYSAKRKSKPPSGFHRVADLREHGVEGDHQGTGRIAHSGNLQDIYKKSPRKFTPKGNSPSSLESRSPLDIRSRASRGEACLHGKQEIEPCSRSPTRGGSRHPSKLIAKCALRATWPLARAFAAPHAGLRNGSASWPGGAPVW